MDYCGNIVYTLIVTCRRRKLPVAVTPAYTSHNTTTATIIKASNRHEEDGVYEQGAPQTTAASRGDAHNKLILHSSEFTAVSEQEGPGVADDDLLEGLCPEDLLNCSTSFCTSLNDSTGTGHVKEAKAPLIHSPDYPHTTSTVSLHSTPVHSTLKPSAHKQTIVSVPTDRLERATESYTPPTLSSKNKSSIPSGTFYGLPLKVKQCLEEHRGIKELYGN